MSEDHFITRTTHFQAHTIVHTKMHMDMCIINKKDHLYESLGFTAVHCINLQHTDCTNIQATGVLGLWIVLCGHINHNTGLYKKCGTSHAASVSLLGSGARLEFTAPTSLEFNAL